MPLLLFRDFLEFFVICAVKHYLRLDLGPVATELQPRYLFVPVLDLPAEVAVLAQDPEARLMVCVDAPEHKSAYFPEADCQGFCVRRIPSMSEAKPMLYIHPLLLWLFVLFAGQGFCVGI